jgi:hypothetical protein
VNSGLPRPFVVSSLAIDPQDPTTVYAGSWGQGIFKSTDGGENWIPFNDGLSNLNIQTLLISSGGQTTLYAGTESGAFRIIDELRPKLSLDSIQYCAGDSWNLSISGALPNASIRLMGTSNGKPWAVPDWRRTGSDGSLIESGTFPQDSVGAHTLWASSDSRISNTISFAVSRCGP